MAYTTINKSTDYFNTKLYTGTGSSHAVSGIGFQPDWVWFKGRNQAYHHYLFDAVRGVNKPIHSALTNAESTQTDTLMSFDSDGFTLGSDTNNGEINSSGNTFASWNWKAGNSAGSSNTDGSITSTVSANQTAGFSIVSYSGNASNSTVGHGLGVAPDFIIIKSRTEGRSWVTGNSTSGWTKWLALESTDAESTASSIWNDTAPTNQVFSVGTSSALNNNGQNFIAYCFAQKTGYSKFGSYVGNGSADNNAFIYTGFKPAWVMIKNTSVADWWGIIDNKRVGYNPTNNPLFANTSATEGNFNNDLLSNGFKIRSNTGGVGTSGNTYIYIAFAEAPLVGNNNVPCTAR
jgi:hypothetical protein